MILPVILTFLGRLNPNSSVSVGLKDKMKTNHTLTKAKSEHEKIKEMKLIVCSVKS